jgi:hypothetical protein
MRSTRILQLVCGTALTLSMAAGVLAQQQQERRQPTSQPQPQPQPAQPSQPGQPPRPQSAQPAQRQQSTPRQTAQPIDRTSTEAQLLRRLEGTWNVQISINPALFAKQVQDDAQGGTPARPWNDNNRNDNTRDGRDERDGTNGQPRPIDNRGTSPDRAQPDQAQPDQVNPTDRNASRPAVRPIDRTDPAMRDQGTPPASGILPDEASNPDARPAGTQQADRQPQGNQPESVQPSTRQPASGQPAARQPSNPQPGNLKPLDGERVTRLGAPPVNDEIPNAQTMNGYAETKLIMGDKILQQTVVVTGGDTMNQQQPRIQPGNRPGSANQPETRDQQQGQDGDQRTNDTRNQPANPAARDRDDATPGQPGTQPRTSDHAGSNHKQGGYTGMSFLSFDEATRTYSIVFMDDMKGEIRYDTGTFDAAANRIVFDGRDPVMGNENPNRPSSAVSPDAPATGTARNDTNRTASSHDNVRVVLELLGNDQHRVTMYKVGGMAATAGQPSNEPNDANTDTNINNLNKNNGRTPPLASERDFEKPANIIYQATFTRTSGTDNERVQEALREAEGRSRTNTPAVPNRSVNPTSPERR